MESTIRSTRRDRRQQGGFTLVELAIASMILIFGVAAVVQLIPLSLQTNLRNRQDTTYVVLAQRMLDLMVNQNVTVTTLVDSTAVFPCGVAVCNISGGVPNPPLVGDYRQGCTLLANSTFNYAAAPVAGYQFFFQDPNDPNRTQYDVRWFVITSVRNVGTSVNQVVAKRFVVGVQRSARNTLPDTVTLSAWVTR